MIGFIASIGLTVALFVSDVAYPNAPLLEGEGKWGRSLIASAIIAIAVSKTCCSFENQMKKKLKKKSLLIMLTLTLIVMMKKLIALW